MDERRTRRVSEAVREELIELIGFEMKDPRLLPVEVRHVNLTPDGKHAHVVIGVRSDDKVQREKIQRDAFAALDHARHYLRHELARRLSLRRVPELHFDADLGPESEDRIEILLARARKSRGSDEKLPSK
jgi:ribosome-binding factor A